MIFKLKKTIENILYDKEDKSFEADLIISNVTKIKKSEWIFNKNISLKQIKKCINLAKKRKKGTPIQYLIKYWEFYGVSVLVGKAF